MDGSASWQIPCAAASHIPPRSQHRTLPTQSIRNNRVLSAPASTLGWQSPSLGHPIYRVAPSPLLTPPRARHRMPGQHLKPRAGSQYGAGSRGLHVNARVKCSQVTRQTLFLFRIHCQHKQNILFPDQNMEPFPRGALNCCCSRTKSRGCCTSPVFVASGTVRTDKQHRV